MKVGIVTAIFVLLFSFDSVVAQENLVLNPSFEEYTECPEYLAQLYLVKNWFNPNESTPDYYNACAPEKPLINSVFIPKNCVGYQSSHNGVGYSGIALVYYNPTSSNSREYLAGHLIHELLKSRIYKISFWCSLAELSNIATSSIGVYFSADSIHTFDGKVLQYAPQIQNPIDSIIKDTTNWVQISDTFTAKGGEKFMIIGNFLDDAHTLVDTLIPNQIGYTAYYYIDDVSLYEIPEDTASAHPFFNNQNAIGYIQKPMEPLVIPTLISPKDSYWHFLHLQPNTEVKLYNALGQLVYATLNYQNNLSTNFLAAGVYFYEVQLESGERLNGKVVCLR